MGRVKPRTTRGNQGDPPSSPTSNIRASTQAGMIETQAGNIESLTRRNEELTRTVEELTRTIEELTRDKKELTNRNKEVTSRNKELTKTNDGQIRIIEGLTRTVEMMQSKALEENNRIPVRPTSQQATQFQNAPVILEPSLRPNLVLSPDGEDVNNGSGGIYHDTFEQNISNLSDQGSILISEILAELRRKGAFIGLKKWNPRRADAKEIASRLLKVMLSSGYIHLFSEVRLLFTAGRNSVWRRIMSAAELPPDEQASLAKYFANVTKKTLNFDNLLLKLCGFVISSAHSANCGQVIHQRNQEPLLSQPKQDATIKHDSPKPEVLKYS